MLRQAASVLITWWVFLLSAVDIAKTKAAAERRQPSGRASLLTRSGWGIATALLLLLLVELAMHSDSVVQNYRAVFGAARAMDKAMYVEAHPPQLLLLGNSRTDNGFVPRLIAPALGLDPESGVFNLGVPGSNMMVLHGIAKRLADAGLLGEGGIRQVLISLDETEFQNEDGLNLGIFFGDRATLWEEGDYKAFFGSVLRLWGYAGNLKGLREPGTLERFIEASVGEREPWGGSAAQSLGYRAGVRNKFQTDEQLRRQAASTELPPDDAQIRWLWRTIDLLRAHQVQVAVLYPPLLNRQVSLIGGSGASGAAYAAIGEALRDQGIPTLTAGATGPGEVAHFANAGHLNAAGGEFYSKALVAELKALWYPAERGQ